MKGIILHGGHGTRLRPLTHTGPKQLLPIANKPMSQFCLEAIAETGITDIAMIIGGVGSNKVQEYYKDGKKDGLWKKWHKNGQLQYEKNYKDGEIIFEKCWDEDGNEIECE